jgi:hypothetical protein
MKGIPIAILLSFAASVSLAQVQRDAPLTGSPDSSNQAAKPSLRQQIQALDLTRDQKMQIRELLRDHKANKETIMANDSLTQTQKQAQLKDLRKQTFMSFNAILTDEQREKWKAMRSNMKKNNNDQQQTQAMEDEINSLPAN